MITYFDLQPLLHQCNEDATLSDDAKREYERLLKSIPENGYALEFPMRDVSCRQEDIFGELERAGFIETKLEYHGTDGHVFHVKIRKSRHVVPRIHFNNDALFDEEETV